MTDLIPVEQVDGVDVVDSRLIAMELGIQHSSFYKLIKENKDDIEDAFKPIDFKSIGKKGTRTYAEFAYLSENQATYLMTLTRNTKQVKVLKLKLVLSFDKAKKVIQQQGERIKELELMAEISRNNCQDSTNKRYLLDKRSRIMDVHGLPTLAQLEGREVVEVEKPVIEVIDNISGQKAKVMNANDLKRYVHKLTGQKIKSKKQLVEAIKQQGRDDLLVAVRRQTVAEDVDADKINEAIALIFGNDRQLLIGE